MKRTIFLTLIWCLNLTPIPLLAEDEGQSKNDVQSGEIEFEETGSNTSSPYLVNQDKAIEWLKQVLATATAGGSGAISEPDADVILHLSAGYLFCLTRTPNCASILDAVLEADIMSDRASSSDKCPRMTHFWETWMKNELEERTRYLVPVGNIAAVTQFNRSTRPRYIKCAATVTSALAESPQARYAATGQVVKSCESALHFFEDVKAKNINILTTTGLVNDGNANKKPANKNPLNRKK